MPSRLIQNVFQDISAASPSSHMSQTGVALSFIQVVAIGFNKTHTARTDGNIENKDWVLIEPGNLYKL